MIGRISPVVRRLAAELGDFFGGAGGRFAGRME